MSLLSQIACTPCSAGEPPASAEEIAELHPLVPTWKIVIDKGLQKLRNTFTFDDENTACDFVRRLDEISMKEGRRPDLNCQGTAVTVTWWSHSVGGLHPNDFIMAGKTDGAYTLAVVGREGDMATDESLPTLADLPRFGRVFASRKGAKARNEGPRSA